MAQSRLHNGLGLWKPDQNILDNGLPTESSYLLFREARTPEELLQLLQLRYRVFRNCRLAAFVPENADGIDVDVYDKQAWHFGLWLANGQQLTAIGYLRVIDRYDDRAAALLEELSRSNTRVADALQDRESSAIPMIAYSPEGDCIARRVQTCFGEAEHLVEVSRLSLVPEYRSLAFVKIMVESILAIGFFGRRALDRALISLNLTHRRFYGRYGFHQIEGTSERYWEKANAVGCAMEATPRTVPVRFRARLANLAQMFDWKGYLCYPAPERVRVPTAHVAQVEARPRVAAAA